MKYKNFNKKDNNFLQSNVNQEEGQIIDIANYSASYLKVSQYIEKYNPDIPIYCFRPNLLSDSVNFFKNNFIFNNRKSRILYSVKSNPDENVLKVLYKEGIKNFDVASIYEIKLIRNILGKEAKMYFMHPIKSFEAIELAYKDYGIRDFSLDSFDELAKILKATNYADDLNLHVRIAMTSLSSEIKLSEKFGILPSKSTDLLLKVKKHSKKIGVCFHVGSQCINPIDYRKAIMVVADIIAKSKIKIDFFDIGGGFPAQYASTSLPPVKNFFNEIQDSLHAANLDDDCEIWCEPGRCLVAESFSLVVRVEARKDNILYINDGTYGGLFDAGLLGFCFPAKAIRLNNFEDSLDDCNLESYSFYGPTCDSIDFMKGPFYLPKNIKTGDYIEIFQLGSYSKSMRSNFNGFNDFKEIIVKDKPFSSIFEHKQNKLDNEKRRSS